MITISVVKELGDVVIQPAGWCSRLLVDDLLLCGYHGLMENGETPLLIPLLNKVRFACLRSGSAGNCGDSAETYVQHKVGYRLLSLSQLATRRTLALQEALQYWLTGNRRRLNLERELSPRLRARQIRTWNLRRAMMHPRRTMMRVVVFTIYSPRSTKGSHLYIKDTLLFLPTARVLLAQGPGTAEQGCDRLSGGW